MHGVMAWMHARRYALPALVEHVVAAAAEPEGVSYLVDAYCGSGLFALTAASRFVAVMGVEISPTAAAAATRNAAANGLHNARFTTGSAETIFSAVPYRGEECAMIVDPPRRGCDATFLAQLVDFAPARVVYVSCGPDTQARDLRRLLDTGYALRELQPFDLFPHTRHIEAVAVLDWVGGHR